MTGEQAEKIINKYGAFIANIKKGEIVQDITKLPYSPGKIRYAIFVYTEVLIKDDMFNDEIKNNLGQVYAMLGARIREDDVDRINSAWRHYKTSEKAQEFIKQKGGLTAFMPNLSMMTEYHNFVADCYGNWGKSK